MAITELVKNQQRERIGELNRQRQGTPPATRPQSFLSRACASGSWRTTHNQEIVKLLA